MICRRCGRPATDMHHIFNAALKKKSEKYGALIPLCRRCHEFYHRNETENRKLKAKWQKKIMEDYGMSEEEWRLEFYRSYL